MDTAINRTVDDKLRDGTSGLLLISDNLDAFAVRVLSARCASRTLDLMYYAWYDDHSGRLLIQEVVKAARRGIKVRMLLDDINPQTSDAAYLALNNQQNIEVRLFNPSTMRNGSILRGLELVWRMFAMTRRMHTKAWIADGSIAIVGGRNIGDAYFDAADTNFRDLDVLLVGNAVEDTTRIFERFWHSPAARPVEALHPAGSREEVRDLHYIDADQGLLSSLRGLETLQEFVAASNDMHWIRNARVIADPPEKVLGRTKRNWLTRQLLPLIEGARTNVDIVSPYFIPGRKGSAALGKLTARGVEVAVLTNSLAATDVAAVHGAYARYRRRLLRSGVKLFELQPFGGSTDISVFGSKGASLHTKAFTVDNCIGFVGSFNFDPRSAALNAEMGVLFEDADLAGELSRRFQKEKAPQTSYALSLKRKRLSWRGIYKGRERQFASEPEAGFFRRLTARIVRYLPIESQL
jgi:putative cardiolipin synthase